MDDVKFVINFDYPNNSEDYIHRIGRTGRSENTGTSYTFFTQSNGRQAKDLISVLTESNHPIDPKLSALASRSGGSSGEDSIWRKTIITWKFSAYISSQN